eukprot:5021329-Prorocentrum_lima.AAC.1
MHTVLSTAHSNWHVRAKVPGCHEVKPPGMAVVAKLSLPVGSGFGRAGKGGGRPPATLWGGPMGPHP